MSKHWKPDEDLLHARLGADRRLRRKPLPPGAGTALLLLGAACIAVAAGLYQLIGPSDVFARDPGADWSRLDQSASR